jgi:hypothetical protein
MCVCVCSTRGRDTRGIYVVVIERTRQRRNKRFTQTHAPDKGEIRALKSTPASREESGSSIVRPRASNG